MRREGGEKKGEWEEKKQRMGGEWEEKKRRMGGEWEENGRRMGREWEENGKTIEDREKNKPWSGEEKSLGL
jgi:hypothetical protein